MLSFEGLLFMSLLNLTIRVICAEANETLPAAIDPLPCKDDRDCPETEYCFHSRKPVCIPCYNCTRKNRQNRIRCARNINECGDCLPGFFSDTYAHTKSWCEEISNNIAEPHERENNALSVGVKCIIFFVICCISMLGLASYGCYSSRNIQRERRSGNNEFTSNRSDEENVVNTSRQRTVQVPMNHRESRKDLENDDISCSFQLQIEEHPVDDKQRAVPYFFDAVSITSSVNSHPVENTTNNTGSSFTQTPGLTTEVTQISQSYNNFQIHDENTTPSFWTPGENYGNVPSEQQANSSHSNVSLPNKRKSEIMEDNNERKKHKSS